MKARDRQAAEIDRAAERLKDATRQRNPINTNDQLAHGEVAITYHRAPTGRMGYADCNKSVVWRKGFKTDPKGPHYNHGNKTFVGNRTESLPQAMAWAGERYGIKEWKRNGMGDYVDASKDYVPVRWEREAKAKRLNDWADKFIKGQT